MGSESDMDKVINIIRALVQSLKGDSSITDVIRDYRNVEGGPIPFRQYGFNSLEEFLKSSGQFFVRNFNGSIQISIVPNEKTAHISKMVQLQKSSSKRRGGNGRSAPPRTPRFSSDQSWNCSSYSRNYRPGPSPKRIIHNISTSSFNYNNNNNNNWERPRQSSGYGSNRSPLNYRTTPPATPFESKEPSRSPPIYTNHQNSNGPSRSPPLIPIQISNDSNSFRSPSLLRQNSSNNTNSQQQYSTISNQQAQAPPPQPPPSVKQPITVQVRLQQPPPQQPQQPFLTPPPTPPIQQPSVNSFRAPKPSSITDRLKIQPQQQSVSSSPTPPHPTTSSSSSTQRPIQTLDTSRMTSVEKLQRICRAKSYSPPIYKFFKLKNKLFQCSLTVNTVCYGTYPQEFLSETEAQEAVALNALNKMKIKEIENKFPMCTDTDDELIVKIYQLIKTSLGGTISKHIPVLFQSTYKQSLANNWFGIIEKSSIFKIEIEAVGLIIFPNSVQSSQTISNDGIAEDNTKLKLPWHEKFWNLYISSVTKTDEISARLIGKEFSVKYDNFITDIEMFMINDKKRPSTIECNKLYILFDEGIVHRIRAEKIDFDQNRCLCYMIDAGCEEWQTMDKLYICDDKFANFPAQAITLSLYGLEDFNENPYAERNLETNLLGKVLVGEILTSRDEYEKQENSIDMEVCIKVVLYDTSGDEDKNLNPIILESICDDTRGPQLERTSLTDVAITHINQLGNVFCHVKNNSMPYLQKIINNLVDESGLKVKETHHALATIGTDQTNQLYLILDKNDQKWYRAIKTTGSSSSPDKFLMFCVDFGFELTVHSDDMYRLDSMSVALNRFPYQALKLILHGLSNISDTTVSRLRGLLTPGVKAFVKVLSPIGPQINVYIRLEYNNILICVNDAIRLEEELESTSEVFTPQVNPFRNTATSTSNNGVENVLIKDATTSPMLSPTTTTTNGVGDHLSSKFGLGIVSSSRPSSSSNALCKLVDYVLPPIESFLDVHVSLASNPNQFAVQPYGDGPKLNDLMKRLQEYCSKNASFIPPDCVKLGEAYAAKHNDGHWYRSIVEKILSPSMFYIKYCDVGDAAVVESGNLRLLPAEFRMLAKQAISASVYGIKPKYIDWSTDDCLFFQKLTVNRQFYSIIKNVNSDKTIELELIDTSDPKIDVHIDEILLKEDRAEIIK